MATSPLPVIYARLKAEPGLTATGLARRIPFSREAILRVLVDAEADGYVVSRVQEMEPGDSGPPRRYWLRGEG